MPSSDQAKQALDQRRGQIDSALSNALADALGGEFAAADLVLNEGDVRKIMDQSLTMAEAAIGSGEMAKNTRRELISRFGSSQPNTPTPQTETDLSLSVPESDEISKTLGPTRDNRPNQTPAQPATEPVTAPESPESSDPLGEGMQHCPYDGQILNPDGTCPEGDHSSLGSNAKSRNQTANPNEAVNVGGNPNPRIANQPANSNTPTGQPNGRIPINPQLPPPITPAIAQASIQQGAKKKIDELTQQIEHTKDKIGDINKKIKKNDTEVQIISAVSACGCFTLILPIFGTMKLFINHQKKSKLKNEAAKLENTIDRLTEERAKIAKQAKLKI